MAPLGSWVALTFVPLPLHPRWPLSPAPSGFSRIAFVATCGGSQLLLGCLLFRLCLPLPPSPGSNRHPVNSEFFPFACDAPCTSQERLLSVFPVMTCKGLPLTPGFEETETDTQRQRHTDRLRLRQREKERGTERYRDVEGGRDKTDTEKARGKRDRHKDQMI